MTLRAEGLRFTYGGAARPALDGVDLAVEGGELVLLEGPSGGGKSTLLRALCGLVPHFHGGQMAGRVTVAGLDTRGGAAGVLGRRAGMLFGDPEAQAVLGTVSRDVAFGLECAGVPPRAIPGRVRSALAAVEAGHLADRAIGTLSGGERQRAALAAVLAPGPAALLLDEPTSQLDAEAGAALAAVLGRLAAEGVATVVAEHRPEAVGPIATRTLAMRDGRLAAPAPAPEYPPPGAPPTPGPVRAALDDVDAGFSGRPVLRGVSLALAAGTVTALGGPNGAGKSTLVRVLAGLHAPTRGRVRLDGADVTALPAERRFPRVGLVGQDPGRHLLTERVRDELGHALRVLGVAAGERRARVAEALVRLDLAPLAGHHPLDLSVGQRERVAIGAILTARPGTLLLDEPTRGMDPARKAALAALLRRAAAEGAAVLVATHDAGFTAAAADRVLRLDAGGLHEAAVSTR